ncbi:outer membrane beta-barrel family protein [Flavobacterium gilvum]|uniref:TonB-dependent receptor n=1 Tax=Flavobacterium gilvum TaxID=1492737 RepID=A0AAC9N5B2_9FLAO|nr:outer membrane beta-barrel family protein [Flavobacterium gilvum]AOW08069.1 TonB-dependent receptor [Flavobacterium gilvum]KFC57873.1 TonB-denpendent receptor [Flavobacterium gilvum]
MKLKLFTFFLLSIIGIAHAENPGIISGRVTNKTTKQPVQYASIVIKDAGKVVSGIVADENGNFQIKNLELKKYTLEVEFIGYKKYVTSLELNSGKKNSSIEILLEEEATELQSVDIVKEHSIIEQKTDRKVINVGKDLLSAGATAAEIMNNIPSVSVDPQTNAVSLRGNSNVRVFVDGKPSTVDAAQLLQQIPSTSIKQIELITNPSAKYNPEGMSGIINIVLNKNAKIGFNGSVNSGVTFGETPKTNSSFDMNYRSGKVNMYANYGLTDGKRHNHGQVKTLEPNDENTQSFDFLNDNTSHLAKVGLDFYLNDTNTISVYTTQNINNNNGKSQVTVDYLIPVKPSIYQTVDSKYNNYTQTYNLDYKKKFKKEGHTLEFEGNYSNNKDSENSIYNDPKTNDIDNKRNNVLLNLDYVNPLTETIKLEAGLETRIENTKNNFLLNGGYNSNFDYERKIYSAYTTFSKQWKKWNAQAGARFEKYTADALFKKVNEADGNFNEDLFTIYPSGFLTYTQNDNNSFNFSVSKRVDRPSIGQVNPIRQWSTPLIDSEGNPELSPQFTNSVELNYTRKTKIGSITSGVFYRQINDEITRTLTQSVEDPEKQILSYSNLGDNNAYGVEVSGNLDFTKWYTANISFDAYKRKIKGYVEMDYVEVDVTTFNARMSNTFKANKNLRFQLTGMYRGEDIGLQFINKPTWRVDAGSSLTILKGSGTITARVSDVFNSMHSSFEATKPKLQSGEFHWESQTAYVGFNYRFGTGKNKAIQRKERDKNETQGSGGF